MGQLIYQDSNHQQTARLVIDDKTIANFSANIDGRSVPRYTTYLASDVTVEEYHEHHIAIHQARIQFQQEQAQQERRMIRDIENRQPDEPEEVPEEPTDEEQPTEPDGEGQPEESTE